MRIPILRAASYGFLPEAKATMASCITQFYIEKMTYISASLHLTPRYQTVYIHIYGYLFAYIIILYTSTYIVCIYIYMYLLFGDEAVVVIRSRPALSGCFETCLRLAQCIITPGPGLSIELAAVRQFKTCRHPAPLIRTLAPSSAAHSLAWARQLQGQGCSRSSLALVQA